METAPTYDSDTVTTLAIGEEAGSYGGGGVGWVPTDNIDVPTTLAIGEEG